MCFLEISTAFWDKGASLAASLGSQLKYRSGNGLKMGP